MERETPSVLRALGLRIHELRKRRGLTQEQAAEKLGMLTPNYARVEQGRMNATVDTLVRIANGLGVSVGDLLKKPKIRAVKPGRPRKRAGTSKAAKG